MSLECKALVAWDVNNTQVETVTVEAPKKNEVRIKIRFSGICHTDLYTLSGEDPEAIFPCILGHEGSGVVESVGPGVEHVQPGDSVICLYIPQCYNCKFCKSSKSNLCSTIRSTQGAGLMPDGTTRFSCRGKRLYHYMGCSAFSQYTVCADISVCKINPEAPLANVCLLGCAVSTGYGAALNTAKVENGSTCAIFGLGAVGLSVVLGCVRSKAKRIIGIDLNDTRLEIGKKLGCTDIINPKNIVKPLQEHLVEITDGGLDFTFECVGNVEVMRTALESCHKGWGVSVIIGVAGKGQEIRTRPFQLVTGRVWKGCAFGGWKSRDDVPKLVDSHCDGQFDFTDLLTDRHSFDQIKLGLIKTENGECIRTVIDMWESKSGAV